MNDQEKIIRELTEKGKIYLETLRLLNEFSESIETKSYVFGGLNLDIWEGRLLRDHHDIDVLTENLHLLEPRFNEQFLQAGYKTRRIDNGDFKAVKGEVKIHLGHLAIEDGTVEWTHNGDKGSIFFPEEWLDKNVHGFYGFKVFTTKPEFEYVLKMHLELMNPEWAPRDKDLVARKKLTKILQSRYDDLSILRERVKST